ncbi:glycosyltransferase family 39 protein [Solirubrobacter soli]|uniref:glycosyltransferase family 39 protein n=1 Tax=Solirubrobacter soli TaxID=363832 RepID=UPI00048689F4|nr:glycosyltransferase family 39 protein [Solirubrobacter soli]
MSVPRSATSVAEVRGDAVVLSGLVIWTIALAALMWGTWGNPAMDTGYDLVAASRTAHGELPYVDYTYWYGPVSPFLLGGIYAIVGTGVAPAVVLGLVISALAIGLTYRLARTFVSAPAAGLAAALVAPAALSSANNSYVLPHSTSAPLGIVLVLGVVLALVRRGEGRRGFVVAGVLAGLTALTRPEIALALYGSLAVWMAFSLYHRAADRRDALALAAPALALPALVYGVFAAKVGLNELLTVNLYPKAFVAAAGHVILDSHAPKTPGSVAKLLAYTALYAAGIGAMLAGAWAIAKGGALRLAAYGAAGLAGLAFVAVLVKRPETIRYYLEFAYAWIPAGVAIAVLALAWRGRRRGSWADAERGPLLVCLLLAAAAASTYASFKPFPNAAFPEATPYLLPLVGVFLAWLHTRVLDRTGVLGLAWLALLVVGSAGLALHDARAETAKAHGPHGTLTAAPQDAVALQGALDIIARETKPGDPILVAPQLSSLYVMSGRKDPLPQLSLLPGALPTPADEKAAIRRMGDVRLVLIDRNPLTLYRHGAFGTTFDRQLAAWVRRDFVRVATVAGPGQDALAIDAWLRRSP